MNRFCSLLALLCIAISAFAYDLKVDGIYYNLDKTRNEAYVTKGTSLYSGEIFIPKIIEADGVLYTVTKVEDNAFSGCSNLWDVTLPASLAEIGSQSFSGCTSLVSITFGSTVPPVIPEHTFDGAQRIYCYVPFESYDRYYNLLTDEFSFPSTHIREYRRHITASDGIKYYIDYETHEATVSFTHTLKVADVNIPYLITYEGEDYFISEVDDFAFSGRKVLHSVTIPSGVTRIGHDAFTNCTYLQSVSIPNSVTQMGDHVFEGCSSLSSLTFPNKITEIGPLMFSGCTKLKSVVIPSTVSIIGYEAFKNCAALASINIPNSVTTIGTEAFKGCSSLKSFEIPTSMTFIDRGVFSYCSGLTSVSIPNTITSIGSIAFAGCSSLASLTIPKSVKSIGSMAFYDCKGLKSITDFAATPQTINDQTFYNVSADATLFVPEDSFYDYYNTTGWIKFRSKMTRISYDARVGCLYYELFEGTTNRAKVVGCDPAVGEVEVPATIMVSGEEYEVINIDQYAFQQKENLTSVTIAPSITRILPESFMNCFNLTSVTIPESVNIIADAAFSGCSSLTTITIPKSVTEIGKYAFAGCTSLTRIVNYAIMPQKIEWGTFDDVAGKTLVIYEQSQYDYEHADYWNEFVGHTEVMATQNILLDGICYNLNPDLRSAKVTSGGDYSGHIDIPKSITYNGLDYIVTSIGESSFDNSGLTSITIPNTVTRIDFGAFSRCSALTELDIPNSVTHIDQAFFRCSNLTTVVIPNSVTEIAESAFSNCPKLTTLINLSPTPQTFSEEFLNVDKSLITLRVPEQSVSTYKAHPYWSQFADVLPLANKSCIDGIYYLTDHANRTASVTWGAERYTGAVSIPNSVTIEGVTYAVTSIGSEAFSHCTDLRSVSIPTSVTTIGDNAFEYCTVLSALSLPASVTTIGVQTFLDCGHLASIFCYATEPPALGFGAFAGDNNNIPVYVPQASLFSYYMADGWDCFANLKPLTRVQLADFNHDGRLSVGDLTQLIRYYQNHQNTRDIDPVFDINGDGWITPFDINELVKIVLQK